MWDGASQLLLSPKAGLEHQKKPRGRGFVLGKEEKGQSRREEGKVSPGNCCRQHRGPCRSQEGRLCLAPAPLWKVQSVPAVGFGTLCGAGDDWKKDTRVPCGQWVNMGSTELPTAGPGSKGELLTTAFIKTEVWAPTWGRMGLLPSDPGELGAAGSENNPS